MSGAKSSNNPDSTSSQDPGGVFGDKDEMAVPPVPTVEHTTGDENATPISSSYNDLVRYVAMSPMTKQMLWHTLG